MRWRMLLDERIYLKEMRHRSVSIRPRGWKDLPPNEAKTLWQAVSITIQRFFSEHPLAELTILSLIQTVVVLAWKLFTAPITGIDRSVELPTAGKAPTAILPLMPAPAGQTVGKASLSLHPLGSTRWRTGFSFAAIALAVVIPLGAYGSLNMLAKTKDVVIKHGLLAVSHLQVAEAAAQAQNFSGAEAAFGLAEEEFKNAKQELGILAGLLTAAGSIIPSTSVSTAGLMLVAGEEMAEGGRYIAAGLATLDSDAPPADRLRGLNAQVDRALPHLHRASNAITMMSADALPEEYRTTVDLAKAQLPDLLTSIEQASNIAGFLALMMGSEEPRRYLLIFQNNAELRPTGGFIGSFALLDVDRGEITNLEIPGGGSYDLQGQLTAKVASPKPLRLINPHWEFQDANWSPDFPTSAQRLAWFYEKSGGPTVDGVIAINATVMERLLAIVGPIEMEEYDVTLDSENFTDETQREVELDYDKEENKPKQFLADLAPEVLERAMNADRGNYIHLARTLEESLALREIQLWFQDAEMQNRAVEFGWAGQMKSAAGDYLQIVHTNIAGQKTDTVMTEKVSHEAKILSDGSTIITLKINRTHNGIKGELFSGVRNVDYLRVYVPLGSSLVEAEGFEIPDPKLFELPDADYEPDPFIAAQEERELLDHRSGTRTFVDNGKTVFANWVQTDPGETSQIKIIYQIPLEAIRLQEPQGGALASMYARLTSGIEGHQIAYSLLVQKQSGTNPIEFVSSVDLPRGYHVVWESPTYDTDDRERHVTSATLENDFIFGLAAESPLQVD